MSDEEFTEYRQQINAQIAALKTVIYALLDHAEDRPLLAARIAQGAEHLTANWLPTELRDDFLDAYQREMASIQKRFESS